jgi:hypothetical protein
MEVEMTKVTKYADPLPAMTDSGGTVESPYCPGKADGWVCTRPEGHKGDHEAGLGSNVKAASWPRKVH